MNRSPSATFFIDLVSNAREVVDARSKKRAQKKELTQKMVFLSTPPPERTLLGYG